MFIDVRQLTGWHCIACANRGWGTIQLWIAFHCFIYNAVCQGASREYKQSRWRLLHLLNVFLLYHSSIFNLTLYWFVTGRFWQPHYSRVDLGTGWSHVLVSWVLTLYYLSQTAEFLFLLWGVYLCYTVRTVPSAFHEPRYMAIAVHNELILSAIFHILRWVTATSQTS